jgi:hypothetical protein
MRNYYSLLDKHKHLWIKKSTGFRGYRILPKVDGMAMLEK